MTVASRGAWRAVATGVAVAALLLMVVGVGVLALVMLLGEATRRDRAFAAILVVTGGSTLALAAGGWGAGRVGAPRSAAAALGLGLVTGLLAVILIVGTFYATLGETLDFHSVGVALGVTELPRTDVNRLPFPTGSAGRDYDVNPPDLARARTWRSIAFVTTWGVSAVIAASLGALAGAGRRRIGL